MTEEVSDLLQSWGLSSYVQRFEDEGIDYKIMMKLTERSIENLFPKIGPRILFLDGLEKVKTFLTSKPTDASNDKIADFLEWAKTVEDCPDDQALSLSDALVNRNTGSVEPSAKKKKPNEEADKEVDKVKLPVRAELCTSERTVETSPSNQKRIEQLLIDSLRGQTVLDNRNNFLECHRRRLVQILIDDEFKKCADKKKIEHSRLAELSHEIVDCFPSESKEAYFIPYKAIKNRDGTKVVVLAKGKLYDRYQNVRKLIRKSGYSSKASQSTCNENDSEDSGPDNNPDTPGLKPDGELRFLKECAHPWDVVKDYWVKTHRYRKQKLHDDGEGDRESYMKDYKGLSQPSGYQLLELDFNLLYPDAEVKLMANWPTFKANIESLLRVDTVNEDDRGDGDFTSLIQFPDIVSRSNVKKKAGGYWRPTKEEVREGFIIYIKDPMELNPTIRRLKDKASELKETLQPFVIVVGDTKSSIVASYVVICRGIDEIMYKLESPLRALDVCFKAYHSLHLKYPRQSEAVWLLLQKAVYGMNTRWDRKLTSVLALLPSMKC